MENILETIKSPKDLKKLKIKDLSALAEEIRRYIIETVSTTGGHLASNLGTVELTVALHYAFDFSTDKLLWDVGHQCYTHKILTARKESFRKLRTAEGVSGFPYPAESEYDIFTVGHAGTAIPTAVGMALGSEETQDEKIVSLIGDGSIVNGASFEGLNNLGLVKRQMLIILNDNSMAIDTTQGALAEYFSRIRLSHTYEDMTKTADSILEHLPGIGKTVGEAIERIKKSIRMALPASQVFEAMDIPYFGPVDGHDIKTLTNLFDELKDLNHPALLHVYTEKGKGYKPAAEQPQNYHSTPPFSISKETSYDEGQPIPGKAEGDNRLSFTKAFSNAITKIAEKDDRIVAITSAMGEGTGLGEFRKKFPDRYYDVGIAESAAVDIAAGLAKQGKKPIVCIYSTFLQRAFDQIFQEVTLQGLSVIFCIDRAGLVGSDGPTHHGLMDIGYLRMLDGIDLISPADENEMHAALEYAVNSDNSTAIRYARDKIASQLYKPFADKLETPFEKGKSVKLIAPENPKAAIITYGQMLAEGIKACDILKKDGIQTELINARFANPIDDELAGTAVKMPLVTVEDHSIAAGFGSAVMEKLSQKGFAAKVAALGVPAKPIRHDTRANQLAECGLNAQSIAETVKKL